jgi:hypothetical protein
MVGVVMSVLCTIVYDMASLNFFANVVMEKNNFLAAEATIQ